MSLGWAGKTYLCEELEEVSRERQTAARTTRPVIKWQKMDGYQCKP